MNKPTEVQKLQAKLDQLGGTIGGVTVGPDATPELAAKEIRESLERLERGEFEVVWDSQLESEILVDK